MNTCNCPSETTSVQETKAASIRPRFRTTEDETAAILTVALPGVRKEDLNLTLLESDLKIEARRHDSASENWKTHRDAAPPQAYSLNVRLGQRFDGTQSQATLESGVLTLRVPLREEAKPRQIAVN